MELETPLNTAHFLVREAERLLKKGKFGEAVKLQDKIVTLLEAAKADSRDNKVTDSIELQIKHHIRQKVVITQRQSRCEKYTKDLKNLQLKMAKANLQDAGLQVRRLDQKPIFKIFKHQCYLSGLHLSYFPRDGIFAATSQGSTSK